MGCVLDYLPDLPHIFSHCKPFLLGVWHSCPQQSTFWAQTTHHALYQHSSQNPVHHGIIQKEMIVHLDCKKIWTFCCLNIQAWHNAGKSHKTIWIIQSGNTYCVSVYCIFHISIHWRVIDTYITNNCYSKLKPSKHVTLLQDGQTAMLCANMSVMIGSRVWELTSWMTSCKPVWILVF